MKEGFVIKKGEFAMTGCDHNCAECCWNKKRYVDKASGLYITFCLAEDPYYHKFAERRFKEEPGYAKLAT
jgi:hypothetical protein